MVHEGIKRSEPKWFMVRDSAIRTLFRADCSCELESKLKELGHMPSVSLRLSILIVQ